MEESMSNSRAQVGRDGLDEEEIPAVVLAGVADLGMVDPVPTPWPWARLVLHGAAPHSETPPCPPKATAPESAPGRGAPSNKRAKADVGEELAQVLAGSHLLLAAPRDDHDAFQQLRDALLQRGYRTECVAPASHDQLANALRDHAVHTLVIHVELLEVINMAELLHLRRQFPAVHWVLAWHSQSPCWVELVVHFQARGCIDCEDSRNFGAAIDTVVAGGLWFPRWLMHALYVRLLSAVRTARLDVGQNLDGGSGVALTAREAQTLELMRQGLTNKEIALRLTVSVNTVKKHLKHAFDKCGLHSRRQGL
jgi:DNA-binding NarL/FixJ family response regulator